MKTISMAPVAVFLAIAVSGPVGALAQDHEADGSPRFASAVYTYTCADGAVVEVAYINMDSGLSLAVVHADEELMVMENVVSASGARYVTVGLDGDDRFVWWARGNEGFLQQGPDGEEEFVHKACVG